MPSSVDDSKTCSVRPSANATFVVDIDKVHFKCDDLGTWTATGTKSVFFDLQNPELGYARGSLLKLVYITS